MKKINDEEYRVKDIDTGAFKEGQEGKVKDATGWRNEEDDCK